jgi:aldehyde:ferredoxin oxidoreductase
MGADHTAGLVVEPGQPLEEIARASQESQILNAAIDSSGFCQFLGTSISDIATFYSHYFGESVSREQVADLAWKNLEEEWEFNRRAGFTAEDDVMPACMKEDEIGGETKFIWDVPSDVVATAYKRFEPTEEFYTQVAS